MLKYRCAAYHRLPVTAFSPRDWLLRVLELQAQGLPGRLDKMGDYLPTIAESRWLGGAYEMSPETEDAFPMWFGGFLPMAYLLRDPDLLERANALIDKLLSLQAEDGWAGPVPTIGASDDERGTFEVFCLFHLANALIQIDDPERNGRVEEYLYRAFKKLYGWTDKHCLQRWSQMVWTGALHALYWLYERRGEDWMLELAHRIRCLAFDYKAYYRHWPWTKPTDPGDWNLLSHIVNNTLSLAAGPLCWQITGDESDRGLADVMLESMDEAHGTVTGHINGDECFSGPCPLQGAELCSIVETMYACYTNFAVTGEVKWMDRAEALAFNSFPATVSPDMETHQYDQQVNQVNLQLYTDENGHQTRHPAFTTNDGAAALFGLVPCFPCCAFNMGQGFPKFAAHQVMRGADGLALLSYAPTRVDTEAGGAPVTLVVDGGYPFRDTVSIAISAAACARFTLELRIPVWAADATLDGVPVRAGTLHRVTRTWEGRQTLCLKLPMTYEWVPRPNGLAALKRGPLVYALKIEEEWRRVTRSVPECPYAGDDYEVFPRSAWNFGVADTAVTFTEHPIGELPFSPDTPPVTAAVWCREIDWPLVNGMAAPQPASRQGRGEPRLLTFIPYGCTNLRLTELPLLTP